MVDTNCALELRQGIFWVPTDLEELPAHKEWRELIYRNIIGLARNIMTAQGLRITVYGAENIPADGGAVLAMNHTGYYDFILGGVPAHLRGKRMVRFMAKKEIFVNPFITWLGKKMKHIPVDRPAGGASINVALESLAEGNLVGIFPEATISRSYEIKDMKSGAARIANKADVPLIPMVCWGSQRICPKGGKKDLGRSKTPIIMMVGEPIPTTGDADKDIDALYFAMKSMLEQVRDLYDERYGPFEDGLPWRPASMNGTAPTLEEAARIDAAVRAERAAKKAKEAEQQAAKAERKDEEKLAKRAQKQLKKLSKRARKEQK